MKKIYLVLISLITICCIFIGTAIHLGRIFSFTPSAGMNISFGESMEREKITFDQEDYKEFLQGEMHKLTIQGSVLDICVETGDSFYGEFEYVTHLKPVFEEKRGELLIKQPKNSLGVGDNSCSLRLTIPSGMEFALLNLQSDVGNVKIINLTGEEFRLSSNVGDVRMEQSSCQTLDVKSDVGDIAIIDSQFDTGSSDSNCGDTKLQGISFKEFTAKADIGDVAVESNVNLDNYELNLASDVGEVRVNGESYDKKCKQKGSEGSLKITGDIGDVRVNY